MPSVQSRALYYGPSENRSQHSSIEFQNIFLFEHLWHLLSNAAIIPTFSSKKIGIFYDPIENGLVVVETKPDKTFHEDVR